MSTLLLASVAHDLRTPLNSVIVTNTTLFEKCKDNKAIKKCLML